MRVQAVRLLDYCGPHQHIEKVAANNRYVIRLSNNAEIVYAWVAIRESNAGMRDRDRIVGAEINYAGPYTIDVSLNSAEPLGDCLRKGPVVYMVLDADIDASLSITVDVSIPRHVVDVDEYEDEEVEVIFCPHGLFPHECNACMVAGDIAFDTDRENRHFGR